LAHGFGSHIGRFDELAKSLVKEQYVVYAHDAQGFGRSEGDRGHIEDWVYYVDDQIQVVESLSRQYPDIPAFLIGETTGALTAIWTAQKRPNMFKGLILSNIPLQIPTRLPGSLDYPMKKLNEYAPKLPIWPVDASSISSDSQVVISYEKDPLAYVGWYRVRFSHEIEKAREKVAGNLHQLKVPVLVLQGTGAMTMSPEGSSQLHRSVASKDKTIKKYEGMRSQLFEDKEKKKVIADVIEWLKAHV